jgi:acyl-CoA thioester hydrolase
MTATGFRHEFPVRFAEVDMQGVVFNSHYLAYVDEAMSHWMRAAGYDYGGDAFDFMVRHAEVDWQGSATYGDTVQIDCVVERWGATSFDVGFDIRVREQTVVAITLTYVGIDPTTKTKSEIPDAFRSALSIPPAS